MDPITDIFRTMHVTAFGLHRLEATAPWGVIQEKQTEEKVTPADKKMSPTDLAHFAMLSRGNCCLRFRRRCRCSTYSLTLRIVPCGVGVPALEPGARGSLGGPRQCLRVDILPDVRQFAISNGNVEDPMVLERPVRGFDSPRSEADDQNPVSLRYELGGLWVGSFHRFVSLLKYILQSRVPAVRAGQRPVLARNDPLDIFGRQRQQTLLIAAAECRKKILHNLDILFDAHRNLSFSLTSSVSELIGRFGTILLGPNYTVDDRLLLLLEQILEDELTQSAAACVHQRATLVELSRLVGGEPELFGQIRHGSDRVLVVARQKDDSIAPLDDRIGRQGGRDQVIKTFHELRAGERLRNEGGGQEAVQLFKENSKRVRRVDDRLAFPIRQGLRNLAMFPERDRQDGLCRPRAHPAAT